MNRTFNAIPPTYKTFALHGWRYPPESDQLTVKGSFSLAKRSSTSSKAAS